MTNYDQETYGAARPSSIPNGATGASTSSPGRIRSATKLIVEAMSSTVVSGDTTFLKGLDPKTVAEDLVDYTL